MLLALKLLLDKMITYWHVSGVIEYVTNGERIKLYAEADDALTSKLYYKQKWENHILQWFIFFCKRSSFIIDAGANVGLFSLAAHKANQAATIYAFEPNPTNLKRLKTNINLNDAGSQINVQAYALAENEGTVSFHMSAGDTISDVSSVYAGHSRSFNHFEQVTVSVPSVSLDFFFKDRKQKIELIKIDVELYEIYVLRGMRDILIKDRPVIFCEIFNDIIKRKQNPLIDNEIPKGITVQIVEFLQSVQYYFYSVTSEGLIRVSDFSFTPMSSMYLLLPIELQSNHYLFKECELVKSQL